MFVRRLLQVKLVRLKDKYAMPRHTRQGAGRNLKAENNKAKSYIRNGVSNSHTQLNDSHSQQYAVDKKWSNRGKMIHLSRDSILFLWKMHSMQIALPLFFIIHHHP